MALALLSSAKTTVSRNAEGENSLKKELLFSVIKKSSLSMMFFV